MLNNRGDGAIPPPPSKARNGSPGAEFMEQEIELKEFDLEAAKAGKPICTRDGSQARIICFDFLSIDDTPIIALVRLSETQEGIVCYRKDGRFLDSGDSPHDLIIKGEWE